MQNKIIRKIDELGRIVLPQEFRNALAWNAKTNVAVSMEGKKIILSEDSDFCVFCGSEKNLRPVKNGFICGDCIAELTVNK